VHFEEIIFEKVIVEQNIFKHYCERVQLFEKMMKEPSFLNLEIELSLNTEP
jgi:hypothetical protein